LLTGREAEAYRREWWWEVAKAMPDDTQIDLRQTVAKLRRQLESRTAERDQALAREPALAGVLQSSIPRPAILSQCLTPFSKGLYAYARRPSGS